jgi:hypothetical protein
MYGKKQLVCVYILVLIIDILFCSALCSLYTSLNATELTKCNPNLIRLNHEIIYWQFQYLVRHLGYFIYALKFRRSLYKFFKLVLRGISFLDMLFVPLFSINNTILLLYSEKYRDAALKEGEENCKDSIIT